MKTSLNVKNDTILKNSRWWLYWAYVGIFPLCIFFPLIIFSYFIIPFVGFFKLEKHSLPTIQAFSKLMILQTGLFLVLLVCNIWGYSQIPYYNWKAEHILNTEYVYLTGNIMFDTLLVNRARLYNVFMIIGRLCWGYVCCKSYSILWNNKNIRNNYRITIFVMYFLMLITVLFTIAIHILTIVSCSVIDLSEWFLIAGIFSPIILNVFYVFCYEKLFTTPSLIPTKEENIVSINFLPSKIEVAYIVSSIVFIVLASLSLLFV